MVRFSDAPRCPRCKRRMLDEEGAHNLAAGSKRKLVAYQCGSSWHVWVPAVETHRDQYA